jgi:membrane protease YdiL (CAAX protease family)
MAADDLENRRPHAPGSLPQPGFSQFLTLGLSLLLIGLLACLSGTDDARLTLVERPIETAQRVFERNLWIEDALATFPRWTQGVVGRLIQTDSSTREEAIEVFEDILQKNGYPPRELDGGTTPVEPMLLNGLRARRAVLLAEVGRMEEAQVELQQLVVAGHADFADAVERAYARVRSDDGRPFAAYVISIAGDDWIGKRLQLRLAMAAGSDDLRSELERTIRVRRDVFADRLATSVLIEVVPLVLGFLVLLVWIARNRPQVPTSTAEIPPPWTMQDGHAVIVRAAFFAIGILVVLGQVALWLDAPLVTSWSALMMFLPMLWLVRRHLLRSTGTTLGAAFGLTRFPRPLAWIGFVLGLFAVDQLGSHAIFDLFRLGGIGPSWSEGFVPFAVWKPRSLVILQSIDGCAWAPVLLEIGFRGLLYATLRCRYRPWQAALLSAALFGAPHVHSVPGWASITWSGFVYALAFERCRSLVPGILCHAWSCGFGLATTWVFYR